MTTYWQTDNGWSTDTAAILEKNEQKRQQYLYETHRHLGPTQKELDDNEEIRIAWERFVIVYKLYN